MELDQQSKQAVEVGLRRAEALLAQRKAAQRQRAKAVRKLPQARLRIAATLAASASTAPAAYSIEARRTR